MSKKLIIFLIAGLFLTVLVVGAIVTHLANPTSGSDVRSQAETKLPVVASFYPLYFFAQQIGGVKAEVTNIVPAGAEPHDYEPTAPDLVKMENSRLIILNGGGLEAWGDNLKSNLDPQRTTIVVAGEGLTTQSVTEDGQTGIDPHVWLDPPLAEKMVSRILQGFIQVDPANQAYYQTRAQDLQTRLEELDAAYQQGLSRCAEKNIITSHASFGYLSATYGLRQVPIAGLSPEAEPSPQQLADIVKLAKTEQIKYIFFESLASPKLAQTIATEIGAQTLVLDPLEGLTPAEAAQGQDYLTIMQANLTNLQQALDCH
jgi:zinc transport system substrate-binding protein